MKAATPSKPGTAQPAASIILFADVYRDGDTGFTIKTRPPRTLVFRQKGKQVSQEIGVTDACTILGIGRACIHSLINEDPDARRIIKWRFTSAGRGKRLFDVQSLLDYLEFTRGLEGKP